MLKFEINLHSCESQATLTIEWFIALRLVDVFAFQVLQSHVAKQVNISSKKSDFIKCK